jgi:hypothetical protein
MKVLFVCSGNATIDAGNGNGISPFIKSQAESIFIIRLYSREN